MQQTATMSAKGTSKLATAPVQVTIPVTDAARAEAFYTGTLGLKLTKSAPGGNIYECGDGTTVCVYPRATASSGEHTVCAWRVTGIEQVVAELKERGVQFEEYDSGDFKTSGSIATMGPMKAAWLRDPDGNILGLIQGL